MQQIAQAQQGRLSPCSGFDEANPPPACGGRRGSARGRRRSCAVCVSLPPRSRRLRAHGAHREAHRCARRARVPIAAGARAKALQHGRAALARDGRSRSSARAGQATRAGAGRGGASCTPAPPRVPTAAAGSPSRSLRRPPPGPARPTGSSTGRSAALPGAKLHFVNTTGTATAADRRRTAIRGKVNAAWSPWPSCRARSCRTRGPPSRSRRSCRAPSGAPRTARRAAVPTTGEVQAAFVHHTVNLNDYSQAEAPAVVLGICRYHRNSNGWNDIGYNFLVDKYGTIYEGRAGGIDQPIVGAQSQGYNSVSTGIANVGTFEDVPQSNEALTAMARLIRWKLPLHGAPTQGNVTVTSAGGDSNRYPAGTAVTLNRISGHRDGNNTACPGTALYNQLPDLRQRVGSGRPGDAAERRRPDPIRHQGQPGDVARPHPRLRPAGAGVRQRHPVRRRQRWPMSRSSSSARRPPAASRRSPARRPGTAGASRCPFVPSKRAVVRVALPRRLDTPHEPVQDHDRPGAAEPDVRQAAIARAHPDAGHRAGDDRAAQGIGAADRRAALRARQEGRGSPPCRAAASRGPFKARIRLRSNGLYRMYLIYPGDKKNLSARGKSFLVRVARTGATSHADAAAVDRRRWRRHRATAEALGR